MLIKNANTGNAEAANMPVGVPKERSAFDMLTIVYDGCNFRFPGGKKEWCQRGDKFQSKNQLTYLLNVVKNRGRNYRVIVLYDNRVPGETGGREILKIVNGEVKRNLLTRYTELLKGYHLPENMSYEIDN